MPIHLSRFVKDLWVWSWSHHWALGCMVVRSRPDRCGEQVSFKVSPHRLITTKNNKAILLYLNSTASRGVGDGGDGGEKRLKD